MCPAWSMAGAACRLRWTCAVPIGWNRLRIGYGPVPRPRLRPHRAGEVRQLPCRRRRVRTHAAGFPAVFDARPRSQQPGDDREFLATVEDAANRILNKIQGVGHGGGVQVVAGSADFDNMERLLRLLGYGGGSDPGLSPETLFDTVTLASPGKTLRRAALIFGGRIPTRAELQAVNSGGPADLRAAIRDLMTGPGFHQFLIRASNDRLLTEQFEDERVIDKADHEFPDFVNLSWAKAMEVFDAGYTDLFEDFEFRRWYKNVQFGFQRAPLELIAHVAENDLPYTEILTAEYIMANPMAAEAYGASTQFNKSNDPMDFDL